LVIYLTKRLSIFAELEYRGKGTTMAAIVQELVIEATPRRVWDALTHPDEIGHWWTNDLNAKPEVGTLAEFRFGGWGEVMLRFQVAELDPEKCIRWVHRQSTIPEWAGTSITWHLQPIPNGTHLTFKHEGFATTDEAYQHSCGNWNYYLRSLQSYLETGKGTPGLPPFAL
jgi:uncharacterized protein YndB with AHSA1/START domain